MNSRVWRQSFPCKLLSADIVCLRWILSDILPSSDILAACKSLSLPQFPYYPLQDGGDLTLQERFGFSAVELALDIGQLIKIGFTKELADVFQAIKVYLSNLDRLDEWRGTVEDEAWLCTTMDQRNAIQHSLLSLPSAEHLTDQLFGNKRLIYEVCRISGLIFGIGVVFPIPYEESPLPRLAKSLQVVLQSTPLSMWEPFSAYGIIIWATTLGGIGAAKMPERRWFVSQLDTLTRENLVFDWEGCRRVLNQILWQDSSCDIAGQNLWAEVEDLRFVSELSV